MNTVTKKTEETMVDNNLTWSTATPAQRWKSVLQLFAAVVLVGGLMALPSFGFVLSFRGWTPADELYRAEVQMHFGKRP